MPLSIAACQGGNATQSASADASQGLAATLNSHRTTSVGRRASRRWGFFCGAAAGGRSPPPPFARGSRVRRGAGWSSAPLLVPATPTWGDTRWTPFGVRHPCTSAGPGFAAGAFEAPALRRRPVRRHGGGRPRGRLGAVVVDSQDRAPAAPRIGEPFEDDSRTVSGASATGSDPAPPSPPRGPHADAGVPHATRSPARRRGRALLVDAPSAPSRCGKRGQQVRRWLERRGRRAVRPPTSSTTTVTATGPAGGLVERIARSAGRKTTPGGRAFPAVVRPRGGAARTGFVYIRTSREPSRSPGSSRRYRSVSDAPCSVPSAGTQGRGRTWPRSPAAQPT